jgi:hypothetical protein
MPFLFFLTSTVAQPTDGDISVTQRWNDLVLRYCGGLSGSLGPKRVKERVLIVVNPKAGKGAAAAAGEKVLLNNSIFQFNLSLPEA